MIETRYRLVAVTANADTHAAATLDSVNVTGAAHTIKVWISDYREVQNHLGEEFVLVPEKSVTVKNEISAEARRLKEYNRYLSAIGAGSQKYANREAVGNALGPNRVVQILTQEEFEAL